MAQDVLEVVTPEEIDELLKVFEKDRHKFHPLHQYVTIMTEYKKAKVEIPQQKLYRYGDVENGVYIIESDFTEEGKIKYITYFIFTASEHLSDLRHALMTTSRIQWTNKVVMFEITFEKFYTVLNEVIQAKNLNYTVKSNYMMRLLNPVERGTVPEGMYLARLDQSHVEEINSNWPHKFPGSEFLLGRQITNNFGLGLFRESDKKLACSALSFQSGGIFVLYTDPEFRGKGFAEVIVRTMSHELHEKERIPFATILLENIPSQKLFTKIGFQVYTKVYFVYYA